MKTLCLYTQNQRLSQQWQELLAKSYEVKSFKEFDELSDHLKADSLVLFHDDEAGEEVIAELDSLHESFPQKNTLVLRSIPSVQEGELFLTHDIGGYGNVHMSDDALVQALEVISCGNIWLFPKLMEHVVAKVNHLNKQNALTKALAALTPREKEVAELVAFGESNQAIAQSLAISQNTVKIHVASIFEKLGIKSRVALALSVQQTH